MEDNPNYLRIDDPKKAADFEKFIAWVKANYMPDIQQRIFSTVIVKSEPASVLMRVNSPLTIWTVDLEAMNIISNLKSLGFSEHPAADIGEVVERLRGIRPENYQARIDRWITRENIAQRGLMTADQIATIAQKIAEVLSVIIAASAML